MTATDFIAQAKLGQKFMVEEITFAVTWIGDQIVEGESQCDGKKISTCIMADDKREITYGSLHTA